MLTNYDAVSEEGKKPMCVWILIIPINALLYITTIIYYHNNNIRNAKIAGGVKPADSQVTLYISGHIKCAWDKFDRWIVFE